jgi:opacity protein-like surface antigen
MRNTIIVRTSFLAAMLTVGVTAVHGQTNDERLARTRLEASTVFGAMIAGKELNRGVNATGGEDLIAKLNHGGAFGVRAGVHNSLLGLEAGFLTTSNAASVRNEFGVAFPNHAERPLFYSGDALFYPFRMALSEGRVRPYVTSGIGGAYVSADLDNIDDKERHNRLMWNAGGGVKLIVGELVLDFRFTNHRLLSSGAQNATNLRSVSVGVGYRFGK